ncbi:MAG: hypothetical protein KIT62_15990 [Cyclobacteriaceae bacterium]|nr:hypothetical protein [Cyclobacteriaceae bacterium]
MDLRLKYGLIEKLVLTEDEFVLKQIKELLEGNEYQFWDNLNPKLKQSIQRGLEQSTQQQGQPHEEVMQSLRERFRK